jgi:putative ABC transport system permease protein
MPDWKPVVRRRLAAAKLEGVREAEVVDELSQHLEDRYQALRLAGTADAEAQRQALEELNGSELLAEELRKATRSATNAPIGSSNRGGLLTGLLYDLKIALRNVRLKPAFSLMVIVRLALGIAGNAAIFSIFNGLFLRPLPFPESARLIDLDETAPKWNLHYVGVSNPDFYVWRKNNSTFDGMAFFDTNSFNLVDRGTAQRIRGAKVTFDLLDVLRLKPALGRTFRPEEDRPNGTKSLCSATASGSGYSSLTAPCWAACFSSTTSSIQ